MNNPSQNKKPNRPDELVNEKIRFNEVLLIGPKGEQLGVVPRRVALEKAQFYELDLLCVAPNATPPVCKILDYGKHRFEAQKKAKVAKRNQKIIQTKEVQLTPQIGEHDLMVKVKAAIRFFADGSRVKVGVRFRGRQLAHPEVGEEMIQHFIELVKDYSVVEKPPVMEGRWLSAILAAKTKK